MINQMKNIILSNCEQFCPHQGGAPPPVSALVAATNFDFKDILTEYSEGLK